MSYEIVRFRMNRGSRIIERGLTLEEAQAHCNRADTRGEGWFDGYRKTVPKPIRAGIKRRSMLP